jgi:hypothetical protein
MRIGRTSSLLAIAAIAAAFIVIRPAPVSAKTTKAASVAALQSLLVATNDLPAGWSPSTSTGSSKSGPPPQCFAGLESTAKNHNPTASFEKGTAGPQFSETLISARGRAKALLTAFSNAMNGCGTQSIQSGAESVSLTISPTSFRAIGDQSDAFKLDISASIISATGYIVATERRNNTVAILTYIDFGDGSPSISPLSHLATDAVDKLEGKRSPDFKSNAPLAVGQTAKFDDGQGDTASITLVRMVDPAMGADQYTTPSVGDRFVAAEFRIVNTGNEFEPEPSSDVTAFDAESHSYGTDYEGVQGCPGFAENLTLRKDDTADGCVVFDVPTATALTKVEYVEQSGGGTGVWQLP